MFLIKTCWSGWNDFISVLFLENKLDIRFPRWCSGKEFVCQ